MPYFLEIKTKIAYEVTPSLADEFLIDPEYKKIPPPGPETKGVKEIRPIQLHTPDWLKPPPFGNPLNRVVMHASTDRTVYMESVPHQRDKSA